jgi:nucleotide-binding universal stress UspA family protein
MGTHGRRGFQRLVLGSVTARVVRRAACSVLTVSDPGAAPDFRRILCPLDLSPSSETTFRYARSVARRTQGRIEVLHVVEGLPEQGNERYALPFEVEGYRRVRIAEAETALQAWLASQAPDGVATQVALPGVARNEIQRWVEERGTSLVVMGIHGRNPLSPFLFGATAWDIIHLAPCPVLTVRGEALPSHENASLARP